MDLVVTHVVDGTPASWHGSHARGDALDAGQQGPSLGEDHADYYFNVAKAVSEWGDPRTLPALIASAGRCNKSDL